MKHTYLSNAVSLVYTPEKCTGCGRCAEVCPHDVFTIQNKKAMLVSRDNCMECGACQINCAFAAIAVHKGVGCAEAMINGILTKGNPDLGTCGCGDNDAGGCC